jgi:hypothetical protein
MTLRKRSEAVAAAVAESLVRRAIPPPDPNFGEDGPGVKEAHERLVADLSGQLQASLDKKTERTPPPLFASANKGPGVHADFERIVETIYQVDAFKDYAELEQSLEVGDQRGDYRTLTEHLDKAERRARRAHALYLGAKLELARWELDSEVTLAGMRKQASEALEEEKQRGERKKMITNDDVRSRMGEMFPDEWRHQELKRVKLKGTVEHLERLAELWKVKCFSLGTMLSNLRK